MNYSESRTAEEICESASKMITFIDLAGHHKYLKTTIFGLTSYCPDFAMLVVSANTGIGECSLISFLMIVLIFERHHTSVKMYCSVSVCTLSCHFTIQIRQAESGSVTGTQAGN